MQRRTYLKRSSKPLRRTRLARISPKRRKQRAVYRDVRLDHLRDHPLCQLTIAYHRFDEREVLAALEGAGGRDRWADVHGGRFQFRGISIPFATEIHHRNKCDGERLTDPRWFASSTRRLHDWVEDHKDQARQEGFLLPLEADKDGRLPDGSQCLTTDEWIRARARK